MNQPSQQTEHLVVIVGAGPAGIFCARKLEELGHQVVLLNRDIRPGGLVEYGIYFDKLKMKSGIRQQFRKVLNSARVHYLGNVRIGRQGDLSIEDLRQLLKPSAIVIAAGAQGTKLLGVPGEDFSGVHHAKELVFHYNGLPPFSNKEYPIGKRVAIIGIGNVMVDIARYLIEVCRVPEIIAVARRGPGQFAYTPPEIRSVAEHIDADVLRSEVERILDRTELKRDEVDQLLSSLVGKSEPAHPQGDQPRLSFRYLSRPSQILGDDEGRVKALRLEDTRLVERDGKLIADNIGTFSDLEVDTVIFAVGDRVDDGLGVPTNGLSYVKNPNVHQTTPGNEAYELFDPETGRVVDGVFVVGWSRQASDGVVGKAKVDAERGAGVVDQYLRQSAASVNEDVGIRLNRLRLNLLSRRIRAIEYKDVLRMEQVEALEAQRRGLEYFKFTRDEDMLAAIQGAGAPEFSPAESVVGAPEVDRKRIASLRADL